MQVQTNNKIDHKNADNRIPITILTGFLGSGKTTMLNHLLNPSSWQSHQQAQPLTAVIMNEFGGIGLDHQLLDNTPVPMALLNGGCVCCEIQGTLLPTLKNLWMGRSDGSVPRYERIVIETTGIADPTSIMETLLHSSWIARKHYLDGVITAVDAVFANQQLDEHFEAVRQVAMADRLLLTKTDLTDESTIRELKERLTRLNPSASITSVVNGEVDPDTVYGLHAYHQSKANEAKEWLAADKFQLIKPYQANQHSGIQNPKSKTALGVDGRIRSFSLMFDQPLPWLAVKDALETLVDACGQRLLRTKAIVNFQEFPERPVVLHAVQHVFYPSTELSAWADSDRNSRFVFITADLDEHFVSRLLHAFTESIGN